MKIILKRCIFEFTAGNFNFSTHWERLAKGAESYYLVNILQGGNYIVSYPANCSPNQSNSEGILKRFLKEHPEQTED